MVLDQIIDGTKFWLISDMHLNHENVKKWCRNDVFRNVKEMNRIWISHLELKVAGIIRYHVPGRFLWP
jgi:calcineurin-like phosphoesterase family protein